MTNSTDSNDPKRLPATNMERLQQAGLPIPEHDECSCHWYDDGDGESGPSPKVSFDPACPQHGRAAQPEEWAESDLFVIRDVEHSLQAQESSEPGRREIPSAQHELVLQMYFLALNSLDDEDDGCDHFRAASQAAEALRHLTSISRKPRPTNEDVANAIVEKLKDAGVKFGSKP